MSRPAPESRRLVLFDIDGTLLRAASIWSQSYLDALRARFPDVSLEGVSFAGKTDRLIAREILSRHGLAIEELEAVIPGLLRDYLDRARAASVGRKHEMVVLPGVVPVLEELVDHPEVHLGLLTGNVREGAAMKLELTDLLGYFRSGEDFNLGAFGDDHHDRHELPAFAVERARREHGLDYRGKQIVIIGDTVHDIHCGRGLGARAIAVGTGRGIPHEELLAENPDHFFVDLSDTDAVLRAILG